MAPFGIGNTRPLGYHISKDQSIDKVLSGQIVAWFTSWMAELIGMCPLKIFFCHFGCSKESDYSPSYDNFSDESTVETLELATDLVIEVINLHSGWWQNLYLNVDANNVSEHLHGSAQPNQLFGLELQVSGMMSPMQKFVMMSWNLSHALHN